MVIHTSHIIVLANHHIQFDRSTGPYFEGGHIFTQLLLSTKEVISTYIMLSSALEYVVRNGDIDKDAPRSLIGKLLVNTEFLWFVTGEISLTVKYEIFSIHTTLFA